MSQNNKKQRKMSLHGAAAGWPIGCATAAPRLCDGCVLLLTMCKSCCRQMIAVLYELERMLAAFSLHAAELKAIEETGRPLHPRDVYDYLDAFERNADGQIGYLRKLKA